MTSLVLGVLATVALVAINAFFVASEFALVKFRPTRLELLVAQGDRRARLALRISGKIDAYLSANQLGITLASIALGWIGEPTFARAVEPVLRRLGAWAEPAAHPLAIGISFALITVMHVVLGELAPKSIAIQRTEAVGLWTAAPLHAFYVIAFPFIWVLNALSRLALRALTLRPNVEGEGVQTPEELRLILRDVRLDQGARRLMDRIVDYTNRVARHAMTMKAELVVLYTDRPFVENMHLAVGSEYTRYLLVERPSGKVIGYVHIKDIAARLANGRLPQAMEELARGPIFVDEHTSLEALRRQFREKCVPLAVVTDGAGATLGIVTLEDLLEEFVGEIRDEYDADEVPPIVRGAARQLEIDGRLTIDVVARELGFTPSDVPEGVETIGGYVRTRLVRPPRVGDFVETDNVRLVVAVLRFRRIARLRIEPLTDRPPVARSTLVAGDGP